MHRPNLITFILQQSVYSTSSTPNTPSTWHQEIQPTSHRKSKSCCGAKIDWCTPACCMSRQPCSALSDCIDKEITRRCKKRVGKIDSKTDAKDMWAAVRQLTGRQQEAAIVDRISAESLNNHYAAISTDNAYAIPCRKETSTCMQSEYVSEWKMFKMLDSLRPTATGVDGLPAWFLRVGAPCVFQTNHHAIFNLSIISSTTAMEWKQASIRPIPKVAVPKQHVDFRPISITPILTRIIERTVVQSYL